jgi:chondroitin 4-sulfotransferase 11
METLERDTEYIVRQAGLESLLLNKLPKAKKTKISNSSRNKTSALIPKYFSQIKEDLLRQLLEIYQLDFDLFNYDSSKYMQIVQKTLKG